MTPTVAIIAQGSMGAASAARLTENGVRVLTSLRGRSEASAKRAKDAGMIDASDAEIAAADVILSIVPPGEALPLAQRLTPALTAANRKPVYADCNAVSPDTVKQIAAAIATTGAPFADAGIIGGPPRAGYGGPIFYYSGAGAGPLERLNDYGLVFRRVDGGVGAASALKMSYGGITKGLTAVGSAMLLAAERAGVADALHAELAASQPNLLAYFQRSVPDMFGKAYRWVAEMEEIAHFTGGGPSREMYEAIAAHYQRLAADNEGEKTDIAALAEFFEKSPKK
jgi:3-hydroxyisobutyrate dehydrogenase-like beta-hydroxyacid dehydrogenase